MDRRWTIAVMAAFAAVAVGCGGGGSNGGGSSGGAASAAPAGSSGSGATVSIVLDGVPDEGAPSIAVAGAGGYKRDISASTTLTDVPAGAVSISAQPITDGALRFTPSVAGAPKAVAAGDRVNVTITYQRSLAVSDPLFADQWHLQNVGQSGPTGVAGLAGEDANVMPAWLAQGLGRGAIVAVVDNGMEIAHEDLAPNVVAGRSHNYVNGSPDPSSADSAHGTAVAGIIAARDNAKGGLGVAPRAGLVAFNAIATSTDTDIADAMTRDLAVAVSNNSWGAGGAVSNLRGSQIAPAPLVWRSAIETGLRDGRGGKGAVYVFAAGNSGEVAFIGAPTYAENANLDGFVNHRGVIAVGAIDDRGQGWPYSEPGANVWIAAPAGGPCNGHAISTTDRTGGAGFNAGVNDYPDAAYTRCFSGTSSSAPIVSGVAALVLAANPALGWRDVRVILARTARKNDPANAEWRTNAAGLAIHPRYGFGAVDAKRAVDAAKTWQALGPQLVAESTVDTANIAIPDNSPTGVSRSLAIAGAIQRIEWVEVTFSAPHSFWGDLEVDLTSPTGTVSRLTHVHRRILGPSFDGYVFGSARHLDEPAAGTWTLTVRDLARGFTGTLREWSLRIYGRQS